MVNSDSDSSGSSGFDEELWIPYAERPEWKDVQPLEQDDGESPVVKIAYSEKFVDIYNYFRAVYKSQEVSFRALKLTHDASQQNPANYTVWHHRRFLLKELIKKGEKGELALEEKAPDLHDELSYMRTVIEKQGKNYQVWQHRRAIVEWLKDPSGELRFCEIMLNKDPKNYHAWQHRQWVIAEFNLFEKELDFLETMLDTDIRNNSAWNQRFFVVTRTAPNGELKGDVLKREFEFTTKAIEKVLDNESSWNYLKGLMDRCDESESLKFRDEVERFCQGLYENGTRSRHLLGTMIDIITEKLESNQCEDKPTQIAKVQELCKLLATEHDEIRQEYWNFTSRDVTARFGS